MFKPIPDKNATEHYTPIHPEICGFVHVLSNDKIDVKMQYPLLNMVNAINECYVRQTVYEKLLAAQSLLPDGYRIRVWDAWRPFSLQQELYEKYFKYIVDEFSLTDLTIEEPKMKVSQYISFPDNNRMCPPLHTTGGAVDITLLGPDNQELEMGAKFDEFSEKAHTSYYEKNGLDFKIRDNRRMLYNCMTAVGFENLPSEWWHYSYGDKVWAYYNDTPALYSGIYTIEEMEKNEK